MSTRLDTIIEKADGAMEPCIRCSEKKVNGYATKYGHDGDLQLLSEIAS
jgi:hypothetical protein